MIKLIELRNKIGYYSFILNLQEKYNEDFEKFEEINKDKIKNLKKYAMKRFDDIIKDKEYEKNNARKNSDYMNKLEGDKNIMKKSDIVNYDSINDKSGLNIENNNSNINNNYNNNLIISKSNSINQEKLSSDLESFNFNDDSIPNKDIQVLSPTEFIILL